MFFNVFHIMFFTIIACYISTVLFKYNKQLGMKCDSMNVQCDGAQICCTETETDAPSESTNCCCNTSAV